jgi:ubiquinone/menaquinone biosynthesis C-methylase UbiE
MLTNPNETAIREYWESRPCGADEPNMLSSSAQFFDGYARIRYQREPEIEGFAEFQRWAGRRVLEVGVGMGADFVRFAQAGAKIVGTDLASRSLELAQRNAETNRLVPTLLSADAQALPFAEATFDLVYSWGVLHHTPDTKCAVREVHRVLRPGGECRVMLYHRRSLLALQCYLRYGVVRLRPFTSVSELIARNLESPGTKAFTRSEAKAVFKHFRSVEIRPVVTAYDVRFGRRRFAPRWMRRLAPSRVGWFLLIRAQK